MKKIFFMYFIFTFTFETTKWITLYNTLMSTAPVSIFLLSQSQQNVFLSLEFSVKRKKSAEPYPVNTAVEARLRFGRRKKSTGSKFCEYGGWGMITVFFLAEKSRTRINIWAGALSWCKIHNWFSVRYWRIAESRNPRLTSR